MLVGLSVSQGSVTSYLKPREPRAGSSLGVLFL